MAAILRFANLSPRQLLSVLSTARKPRRTTAGTALDNRVALSKCITLCGLCEHKFNAPKNNYERAPRLPLVFGQCDGCRDDGMCTAFLPKKR